MTSIPISIRPLTLILAVAVGLMWCVNGARAAMNPALMGPVKSIYDHYLKIQSDLAHDSLRGVAADADAIAKAVRSDDMKMMPAAVASKAEALAEAPDLKAARVAFRQLSAQLIQYLTDHHAEGDYIEVYCPMAHASWLQADPKVNNPYLGPDMSTCGQIKN